MAAALPEYQSHEFPFVAGYYRLVEAKRPVSDQYILFCNALHGNDPSRHNVYRMFANADGRMSLLPRIEEGGREVWDFTYISVLRRVACTFTAGTPFGEMQDDCSTSQTTVTFRCPSTLLFNQLYETGNRVLITCIFKRSGMKATHECNGVRTRRVWRRVRNFDVPDVVEIDLQAVRRARRERNAPSESSVESDPDDEEDSGAGDSDSDDEDPEMLRRADSTTPTQEMDECPSGANKTSYSPPKPPPPPPPSPCCFDKLNE